MMDSCAVPACRCMQMTLKGSGNMSAQPRAGSTMNDKMRVINQCEVCDEEKSVETVRAVCAASLQEVSV